ncbi:hypothetical protein CGZ80_21225, partial [Rhodopirellula sp. MGV]
ENPYPPPEAVIKAIQDAATGPLNRYPDPTAKSFRNEASRVLGVFGWGGIRQEPVVQCVTRREPCHKVLMGIGSGKE